MGTALVRAASSWGAFTPPSLPAPRRTRDFGAQGLAMLAGSVLSSFAIVWIFFYELTLLSGAFGFIVCWYAVFLLLYGIVTSLTVDRSSAYDRLVTTVVATCAAIIIGLLLYIITWVVVKGVAHFTYRVPVQDLGLLPAGRPAPLQRRRRRPGNRRDARAGRPGGTDGGAVGLPDCHLPERGRWMGYPVRPDHRHRDERHSFRRRRRVHLRRLHRVAHLGLLRICRLHGALRPDAALQSPERPKRCSGWCPVGCARRRWHSAHPNGAPCARWSCPPPARVSSPPLCWVSPSRRARRRRCSSPRSETPT